MTKNKKEDFSKKPLKKGQIFWFNIIVEVLLLFSVLFLLYGSLSICMISMGATDLLFNISKLSTLLICYIPVQALMIAIYMFCFLKLKKAIKYKEKYEEFMYYTQVTPVVKTEDENDEDEVQPIIKTKINNYDKSLDADTAIVASAEKVNKVHEKSDEEMIKELEEKFGKTRNDEIKLQEQNKKVVDTTPVNNSIGTIQDEIKF